MRRQLARRRWVLVASGATLATMLLVVAVAWAATLHVTVRGSSNANLAWIACPPSGVCVAEGEIQAISLTTLVAPVSRAGQEGKEVAITGAAGDYGVACPAANFCVALAYDPSNTRFLVAIPVKDGVPQTRVVLPNSARPVSCGGSCSISHSNGVFNLDYEGIARDYVLGGGDGQCVSASLCFVLSVTGRPGPVKVTTVNHGRVERTSSDAADVIPLEMACQNATECVAVGDAGETNSPGVLATVTDGRVGQVQRVPRSAGYESVNCTRAACLAFFIAKSLQASLMVPIVNGVVGTAITTKISMSNAACGRRTCLGLGEVLGGGKEGTANYAYSKIITFTYSAG